MGKKIFVVYLFISLGLYVIICLLNAEEQKDIKIDWERLKEASTAYFDYPSSENAYKFYLSLPEEDIVIKRSEGGSVKDFIVDNFGMLITQIYASDRNAVKVAFRLYNISDGYFTTMIDMTLGDLIRINARLLLEELVKHKKIKYIESCGPSVDIMGEEYVDRFKAQELEIRLRIKALESVQDKELREIRDECIRILKESLKDSY